MKRAQCQDAPTPASPCTGVCTLDAAGRCCIGCLRTGDEIMEWPAADAARRHEILRAIAHRRLQAGPAANGSGEVQ